MEIAILWIIMGIGLAAGMGGGSPGGIDTASPGAAAAVAPAQAAPARVAEDQTPTGRFTTAAEVRMILDATQPQWIALRPYEGQDLLYFTNLLAWRCGLLEVSYAVNDGALQPLLIEPCYIDEAAPNALKMDGDVLPYVALPLDSVRTVRVQVLYDDLSEVTASYDRTSIQIN